MLFSSPGIQNVNNVKSEHQLAAVESRLKVITTKLASVNVSRKVEVPNKAEGWDWAKSYANWTNWEDIDELQQQKQKEETKLDGIVNKRDALGHYHDHSKERAFFELPEADKFKSCEENRKMGNYLFQEGVYPKAAEHYQIAIAYYEYCFPTDTAEQARLDELRRACLCNISLCYQKMGYLRQAIESANTVLKETNDTHSKALFRRAQAYQHLHEYEHALRDLKKANELMPGDSAIAADYALVKTLVSNASVQQQHFAKAMLISGAASKPTSNKPAQQSSASGLVGGDSEVGVSSVLNCSLPLEPLLPSGISLFLKP